MWPPYKLAFFLATFSFVAADPSRSEPLIRRDKDKDVVAISGAASLYVNAERHELVSQEQGPVGEDESDDSDTDGCVKEYSLFSNFCEEHCLPPGSALSGVIQTTLGSCASAGFPEFDHSVNVGIFQQESGNLASVGDYQSPNPCNAFHLVKSSPAFNSAESSICEAFCIPQSDEREAQSLSGLAKGSCFSQGYPRFVGDAHITMYLKTEMEGLPASDDETTQPEVDGEDSEEASSDAASGCTLEHNIVGNWCEEYCLAPGKAQGVGNMEHARVGPCAGSGFTKFDHKITVNIFEDSDGPLSSSGNNPETCDGSLYHVSANTGLCESFCVPNTAKANKEAHHRRGTKIGGCAENGHHKYVGKGEINMYIRSTD